MQPSKKKTWKRISILLLVVFWVSIILLCLYYKTEISPESLKNRIPTNPFIAVITLSVLFGIKSFSVFVYCGVLYAAVALIFPLEQAIAINILGTVIMVALPYLIGRKAGAGIIEHLVHKFPKLSTVADKVPDNGIAFTFFPRLMGIPSDPLSMLLGAMKVLFLQYLIGSILGLLPLVIVFSVMGFGLYEMDTSKIFITVSIYVIFTIVMLILYKLYKKRGANKNDL